MEIGEQNGYVQSFKNDRYQKKHIFFKERSLYYENKSYNHDLCFVHIKVTYYNKLNALLHYHPYDSNHYVWIHREMKFKT